jgi:hypothetical protein
MRGPQVDDAEVIFEAGANILAGESDTGKSVLLHCLDYIFGADEMKKRVPEIEPYAQLYVEFANSRGATLTLERSLSGGDLEVHDCPIADIQGSGRKIAARRYGRSVADDVTSLILPFANIPDATLRKNDRGEVQRLTIRTFMPTFLVDEISVIAERSPVLGERGYDDTARKRLFAFMLSGKDDTGVIATERRDIVIARLGARLGVISDLLEPLERRLEGKDREDPARSIEKVEAAIASANEDLAEAEDERAALHAERQSASATLQRAETQIVAIDELLTRYELLDERYASDLERLDFIAEGAHFFAGLQEVNCPLCDQLMTPGHAHVAEERSAPVYEAARAEAAKILAQRKDLTGAIDVLQQRRNTHEKDRVTATRTLERVQTRLRQVLAPRLTGGATRLDALMGRRVELETLRSDLEQVENLRLMKDEIERASKTGRGPAREWEPLPASSLRAFCGEVETVLKDWGWKGEPRVEFDQQDYDLIIDGQTRQSHGKGIRGVLYAAFAVALLRYCLGRGRSHPGFVIVDSPLTAYKKGKKGGAGDGPVDAGVEKRFWQSLAQVSSDIQIIVIENKEPPPEVGSAVHFEWFAGEHAQPGDRVGFVPVAIR